jgi:RIO kinase 2
MPPVITAVSVFRDLDPRDLSILQAIESSKRYKYVPPAIIHKPANLPPQEVAYRLPKLRKKGLLLSRRGAFVGYSLTTAGYDVLAIDALVRSNTLEAFGKPVGVGKEADVYEALKPDGTRVAVKFHRLGRTSFKQTKRKRGYSTGYLYPPDWHSQSRISAQNEIQALELLHLNHVAVPLPIRRNRHVVVMGMIDGHELYRETDLLNPKETLHEILLNIRKAYRGAHIIHADLSPYNIILKPDQSILIIDWPQYVTKKHPEALHLLKRDIQNVLRYFERRYNLKTDVSEALTFVRDS